MKRLAIIPVLALAAFSTIAFAKGDAQAGAKKAAQCESCHGKGGVSQSPLFPILAGQYEDYLIHALTQYRSGERKNAIMNGMAGSLSDEDIADLAAYFSSQPTPLYTPSERR